LFGVGCLELFFLVFSNWFEKLPYRAYASSDKFSFGPDLDGILGCGQVQLVAAVPQLVSIQFDLASPEAVGQQCLPLQRS
jgi:hypothetical protein